jgi:hypothetical protein
VYPTANVAKQGGKDVCVDALYFDKAPETSIASSFFDRLKKMVPTFSAASNDAIVTPPMPSVLREFRQAIQRHAERGGSQDRHLQIRNELQRHGETLAQVGLAPFASALAHETRTGESILRLNYLCMQCERILLTEAGFDVAVTTQ